MRRRELVASVTDRGQVTIPAEVRKALGIKAREKVIFVIEDGNVSLKRPKFTIETAYGSVPPLPVPMDWSEMRRVAEEEQAQRVVRKRTDD
jgi:AbrB family looped-hinge helix DNA binding protein